MPIKLLKNTLKFILTFLAGFTSTIPFVSSKLRGYPFAKPVYALDKDWLEIGSDIETTTQKTKK
jgi:hypothetical protein